MSARDDIREALEDAGVEFHEVKFFRNSDAGRGWYYRTDVEAEWQKLGDNVHEALAAIADMPDPNEITFADMNEGPVTISPETYPDLYDDFGNPVDSPFGHR